MELLDLYDDNGNILNEKIIRGEKPEIKKNIMLSIVFIKDKNNKYLIQKTSKEKGSKYSTTGGHVISGEDGLTTIIREIEEELGLFIEKEKIKFIDKIKYPTKQCIFNVFELIIHNINLNSIKIQTSEVESVCLLTKDEIYNLINEGKFLETHGYIFKNYIK